MSSLSDIGNYMHLYLDEIDPGKGTDAPTFLIKATAQLLNQKSGRNWIPIIVKETNKDQYEVIGNAFVYAVAQEARLERVWCIIADDSAETAEVTQALAMEVVPKINLSKASRDEIAAALEFLINQPASVLKSVKPAVALNRIDEAPRQYWKTLDPIATLNCGITKGAKLNALSQVFYLTPQPIPETVTDVAILNLLPLTELRAIAKRRDITGISRLKKNALVERLSQPLQ